LFSTHYFMGLFGWYGLVRSALRHFAFPHPQPVVGTDQPTCSRTPTRLPLTWTFISCPTTLKAQFIEGTRHPDLIETHLHVEHSEDGQQLARAELGQLPSLKAHDGFPRKAAMGAY
jgi:hypothetical protein